MESRSFKLVYLVKYLVANLCFSYFIDGKDTVSKRWVKLIQMTDTHTHTHTMSQCYSALIGYFRIWLIITGHKY